MKSGTDWQKLPVHGAVFAKPCAANLTVAQTRYVRTFWNLNTANHEDLGNLT
jgi:hypothetical protein